MHPPFWLLMVPVCFRYGLFTNSWLLLLIANLLFIAFYTFEKFIKPPSSIYGDVNNNNTYNLAECLKCYSCDGPEECAAPREELCPQNNECFTVAQNYDIKLNGLRKGCSPTCDRVNIEGKLCRTCKFELCNGKTGLGKAFEKLGALPSRRSFGPKKSVSGKKWTSLLLVQLILVLIDVV